MYFPLPYIKKKRKGSQNPQRMFLSSMHSNFLEVAHENIGKIIAHTMGQSVSWEYPG